MSDFLQSFLNYVNYEASTELKLAIFALIIGLVIFNKIGDF